jgi:hypothetical protein
MFDATRLASSITLDVTGFGQALAQYRHYSRAWRRKTYAKIADHWHCRLLRARRERPRRRAAEQRYEGAAFHVEPPPPESVYRTFSLP